MSLFSKKGKDAPVEEQKVQLDRAAAESEVVTEEQLNEVMKKYDRESNTRIWVGVPHTIVSGIMSLFSQIGRAHV